MIKVWEVFEMMVTYIDPGTGSMLVSAIIASISVIYFLLKDKIYRVFSKKGEQGDSFNLNKHYKLVIYSEGKQYYNVFKPLLKEFVNRGINATFLTSDKEDPILSEELEGITAIFLGTGREAYYKLNRISADLVLMTTPGLDVLDIKRSKKVKHYCHITHSLGSCSNYRTFGLDYFDSVLIGGEGNVSVIRELESKRKLPRKEVKIIGHTYLDVLRQKIATLHADCEGALQHDPLHQRGDDPLAQKRAGALPSAAGARRRPAGAARPGDAKRHRQAERA